MKQKNSDRGYRQNEMGQSSMNGKGKEYVEGNRSFNEGKTTIRKDRGALKGKNRYTMKGEMDCLGMRVNYTMGEMTIVT